MSLGLVVLTDEGVVLAAESLGTLLVQKQSTIKSKCPKCNEEIQPNIACPKCSTILGPTPTFSMQIPATHTYYCQKLFKINKTTGLIIVGNPTFGSIKAQQIIFSFINWLKQKSKINDYTEQILQDWQEYCDEAKVLEKHTGKTELAFAGIILKDIVVPFVQNIIIENGKMIKGTTINSGIMAIGVHEILDKMFGGGGIAEYPVKEFPLQDAVEFIEFLIKTQIGVDKYTARIPRVGGDIDIAIVHPNYGFRWVKQKELLKMIMENED